MNAPAQIIPVPIDLTTHVGIATELLTLLTQSNLQIPISKTRDMGEILDWLEAIRDEALVVSDGEEVKH